MNDTLPLFFKCYCYQAAFELRFVQQTVGIYTFKIIKRKCEIVEKKERESEIKRLYVYILKQK